MFALANIERQLNKDVWKMNRVSSKEQSRREQDARYFTFIVAFLDGTTKVQNNVFYSVYGVTDNLLKPDKFEKILLVVDYT